MRDRDSGKSARDAVVSSTPLALFQAPSICCITMRGMESGSEYAAPFHATANWRVGRSGSRIRTSEPVK